MDRRLGVTAAVAATAAFAAFQFLGKTWLEAHFAERLEKFKHDQNQEIERLRYRINALMDRTTKLHQHEFEVLPEIWNKLGIAFSSTLAFTSLATRSPELDQMGEAQFSEFLASPTRRTRRDADAQGPRSRFLRGPYRELVAPPGGGFVASNSPPPRCCSTTMTSTFPSLPSVSTV